MAKHWLAATNFRRSVNHVTDVLLGYSDEAESIARFPVREIWEAFWHMVEFARLLATNLSVWPLWPDAPILRLLKIHKRLFGIRPWGNSTWLTGDAALGSSGCINWRTNTYFQLPPQRNTWGASQH